MYNESIKYAFAEIESALVQKGLSSLMKMSVGDSITVMKEVHRSTNDIPMLYSEDYINTKVFKIHIIRKKI
jgi:GntR family transcriptional regulator